MFCPIQFEIFLFISVKIILQPRLTFVFSFFKVYQKFK